MLNSLQISIIPYIKNIVLYIKKSNIYRQTNNAYYSYNTNKKMISVSHCVSF